MCVNDKLTSYLAERIAVVSIRIRFHLLKEPIHFVMVGFQKFERVRITGFVRREYVRYGLDHACDDAFLPTARRAAAA